MCVKMELNFSCLMAPKISAGNNTALTGDSCFSVVAGGNTAGYS